jgi:hypothetical protein
MVGRIDGKTYFPYGKFSNNYRIFKWFPTKISNIIGPEKELFVL